MTTEAKLSKRGEILREIDLIMRSSCPPIDDGYTFDLSKMSNTGRVNYMAAKRRLAELDGVPRKKCIYSALSYPL